MPRVSRMYVVCEYNSDHILNEKELMNIIGNKVMATHGFFGYSQIYKDFKSLY